MCTVSFVNSNGRVIITSNRDEKITRPCILPKNYRIGDKDVVFPKDSKEGGTWHVVDNKGTVLVLLNGGIFKHEVNSFYRKSRGLVVLEMISQESPKDFWNIIDLDGIESFTLILYQEKKLFQLIWNGVFKGALLLNVDINHIWSSATLYPQDVRLKRINWFNTFLKNKKEIVASEMLHFHRHTEYKNEQYGLVINRNNILKTLSITQTIIEENKVVLDYYDLITEEGYHTQFFYNL